MACNTDQLSGTIDLVVLFHQARRYIVQGESSMDFMEPARICLYLYGSFDHTGKIEFPLLDTGLYIPFAACWNWVGGIIEHGS